VLSECAVPPADVSAGLHRMKHRMAAAS